MRLYVMGVILIATSSPSAAADWRLADTANNGTRTYLDVSSIVISGDYRTVWQKVINSPAAHDGVSYSIVHWRYNCSTRTSTLLSFVEYKANGVTITSQQIPSYEQEQQDVAPDTIGETILNAVCSSN